MSDERQAVADALDAAFRNGGDMVTRWALAAEVIDPGGERAVWVLAPDGAKAWDTLGLLAFAMQVEQAEAVRDALEGDA